MDAASVAAKAAGSRKASRGFLARCPAHDDRQASLSIADGRDGRVLVNCFAGCELADVLAGLGLEVSDLFTERSASQPAPTTRTMYSIGDRDGRPVAVHVREDGPSGKRMSWRLPDGTVGLSGTRSASLPLYRIREALESPEAVVVVTEGEKAADSLRARGVVAVGTVTGAAATPSDDVLADLAGRHVILWPDADDAGRAHMRRIGERLVGMAASVRVAEWRDGGKGADAADYPGDPWDILDTAELYVAGSTEPTPTWRTLDSVPDDPPGELLFGLLEPGGPTLAYAPPGVGKGMTGAWLVTVAQAAGMRPLIFDAERRPREWSRRVAGLGGDRARVVYLEPTDLGTRYAGRPFWDVAEAVVPIVQASGADLFILDSLLPASGIGEERLRSDAQAPFLFVAALDSLGVTSLSFGHPPKGQPEGEPYGSMAWLAAFRMTWLGALAEGDGHRIRWRPRKRNERGHVRGFLLAVDYGPDGRPSGVDRADDDETTRDWLLAALIGGPRSLASLAEESVDDMDLPAAGELDRTRERLGRTLRRMARDGWVERLGQRGSRDVRWRLRERP
jgi:5S rRNA maturation endonuclease (ribonuclease M5)